MSASKRVSKNFEAALERTADRLRWVIARIPFDAVKLWGKRGQIKIQGEINGFPFSTTLFPSGKAGISLSSTKKCWLAQRLRPD